MLAWGLVHLEIEEKLILKEIAKLLTSRRRLWFLSECFEKTGHPPIGTHWVDIHKGDETHAEYRSRLVA